MFDFGCLNAQLVFKQLILLKWEEPLCCLNDEAQGIHQVSPGVYGSQWLQSISINTAKERIMS